MIDQRRNLFRQIRTRLSRGAGGPVLSLAVEWDADSPGSHFLRGALPEMNLLYRKLGDRRSFDTTRLCLALIAASCVAARRTRKRARRAR